MPGLKELSHFRDELSKLGNEREVTAEWGEVYDELPLPSSIAPAAPSIDVDNLLASLGDSSDLGELSELSEPSELNELNELNEPGEMSPLDSLGDFAESTETGDLEESADSEEGSGNHESADLDALFAGLGESSGFEEPPVVETPVLDESFPSDTPEISDISGFDDLLSSLPLDAPDATEVSEVSDVSETKSNSEDEIDSFAMPDFDFGNPDISGLDETNEVEEISEPDELSDVESVNPDEMDFTPSFEMEDTKKVEPPASSDIFGDIEDLPSDSGFIEPALEQEFSQEVPPPSAPKSSSPDDFSDFSVPEDLNIVESVPEADDGNIPSLDGFDGFSLDVGFLKTTDEAASADPDEFHIPGFSDFTSGSSHAPIPGLPTETVQTKKGGKKEVPLKISDEDFITFLDILATFPLNLRIAIEEYLSGEPGTEFHKMELVNNVLTHVSIRKIAKALETSLDRSIPIPKDYEKKTVADYEREKASLKYVFFNKILPATILFTIAATLTLCIGYLSYQFIIRPVMAEDLYKKGYVCIEDGRYTESIKLFDEAVQIWNKKKWYFKYARAFKDKKQYISAELMYERLLDRFKNDKAAGLEYAQMLRLDLRNFEKAETILKRRLLDYYVNDKDGLMLLGDTYLDWAEEDSSKYEEARRTYATLIELYGNEDPYLARMMRFFIRTDKLIQVLPLKEHFMEKGSKLGAEDLVELSGYLLEKRYNPGAGETEFLRNQIEDVRTLLSRAVKADEKIPEAHYNMGRFFIYNYDAKRAASALDEALFRFDNATPMSPKRVLAHIDAFRLRGELFAEGKEYPYAQKQYTLGISLYEEQRQNRTILQNALVGKLYADYADIDYFISGDLDRALFNYTKATLELNNTPSIRYRLGYINYQKQDFEAAMNLFTSTQAEIPADKNLLYGFGNTLYRRGDFYAAQGYLERLMEMLEAERIRKGVVFPHVRIDHAVFVEQYMYTSNNLGVTLNRLASRTGDSRKNGRALALFAESTRAWDSLTRNPETMIRSQGANLSFINIQNVTHPQSQFVPEIYAEIPRTLENEKVLQQRIDQ